MADFDWGGALTGLSNLYGNYQGAQNANNINNSVQSMLGQNASTTANQIGNLSNQIGVNRQQAQDMYNNALGQYGQSNSQLQGDIGNLTTQLRGLSDPNSPYMQNARQAIERKDAAAGRRSQWGEREVQLAGTLADYVGKYGSSMQNSITAAQNQINQNNQGLASLYSQANMPADRNLQAMVQMLQQQQSGAGAMNTTGRQAANSATNNMSSLLNSGIGGLRSLFGNNMATSAGGDYGTSNLFDWGSSSGGMGALNSLTGMGSTDLFGFGQGYYDNADFGTTSSTGDPYSDIW